MNDDYELTEVVIQQLNRQDAQQPKIPVTAIKKPTPTIINAK